MDDPWVGDLIIIEEPEPDKPDNYQRLKSFLDQIIGLQDELFRSFPSKPEPEFSKKYNQLRTQVSQLVGDPDFSARVPIARDYSPWSVGLLVLLLLVSSTALESRAVLTSWAVFRWLLSAISTLLAFVAIAGAIVFYVGYNSDPGNFRALLYSRNSELREKTEILYHYCRESLQILPLDQSSMTPRERALVEQNLDLRMGMAMSPIRGGPAVPEQVNKQLLASAYDASARDENVRNRLRRTLTERLGVSDLRSICYDLGVDYESLGGENKRDKVVELIIYLERHQQLQDLVMWILRQRPDIEI